ncbi:MAG: hypothetical protein ACR2P8_14210, partial [Myxococcota bacterium]
MIRSIATLAAVVGMAGPAFGQVAALGHGLPEIHENEGREELTNAYADCDRRYRSFRARNDMRPSQRQAALASCRAAADLRVWQEQLADARREAHGLREFPGSDEAGLADPRSRRPPAARRAV